MLWLYSLYKFFYVIDFCKLFPRNNHWMVNSDYFFFVTDLVSHHPTFYYYLNAQFGRTPGSCARIFYFIPFLLHYYREIFYTFFRSYKKKMVYCLIWSDELFFYIFYDWFDPVIYWLRFVNWFHFLWFRFARVRISCFIVHLFEFMS